MKRLDWKVWIFIVSLVGFALIVSSCEYDEPTQTNDSNLSVPSSTHTATSTNTLTSTIAEDFPESTYMPTVTETLTSTSTTTPTPSNTPTIGPEFANAKVLNIGYLANGQLMVTVEIPGGVEGRFIALLGEYEFKCEILEQYPDRLYCYGTSPKQGIQVELVVFVEGSDTIVFQKDVIVPYMPTETPTPTPQGDGDDDIGSGGEGNTDGDNGDDDEPPPDIQH